MSPDEPHQVTATGAPTGVPSASRSPLRRVFMGPRRLRAGWRVLMFSALVTAIFAAVKFTVDRLGLHFGEGWSVSIFLWQEPITLAIALIATAIMGRIDRLPFRVFGITWSDAFRGRFWEGSLWGFLAVAVLVGAIALLGGYQVRGFALHGGELVRMAALWLAAMILLGISEEIVFRGYFLSALTDGAGFWLAAVITSLDFVLAHAGKPMENVTDLLSIGLIGLFFCFTVRRTGTLWFAIGFHFAFDFAALCLFGAPNTGNQGKPMPGHLLDSTFSGPDWLTGGVRGVEASGLVFVIIALLFVLFHATHRETKYPIPHD
jgi:membrane protease YdiL (CAAX protease family)